MYKTGIPREMRRVYFPAAQFFDDDDRRKKIESTFYPL